MSWPYEQREAVDARGSQDLTLRREKEVTGEVTETVAPSLPQKPPGHLVETPSPPCLAIFPQGTGHSAIPARLFGAGTERNSLKSNAPRVVIDQPPFDPAR